MYSNLVERTLCAIAKTLLHWLTLDNLDTYQTDLAHALWYFPSLNSKFITALEGKQNTHTIFFCDAQIDVQIARQANTAANNQTAIAGSRKFRQHSDFQH